MDDVDGNDIDADDVDIEVDDDDDDLEMLSLFLDCLRGTLAGVGAGGKALMARGTPPSDMRWGGASIPDSHCSAVRAG